MWNEAQVVHFEVLPWNLPTGKETMNTHQVCGLGFTSRSSQLKNRRSKCSANSHWTSNAIA